MINRSATLPSLLRTHLSRGLLCLMGVVSASTVHAQSLSEFVQPTSLVAVPMSADNGAAERILAAGQMRTITQQVAAAACHLNAEIEPKHSRRQLAKAQDAFAGISDALLNGSLDRHIKGGVGRAKTVREIKELATVWTSTGTAIDALLSQPSNTSARQVIQSSAVGMSEQMNELISQLTAEFANPSELLLVDALMIDIAGRQSMLTQQVSQQFCAIWSGDRSDAALMDLSVSIKTFEASLNALHDGAPSLGIVPAVTPRIEMLLEEVQADWQSLSPAVEMVLEMDGASDEMKSIIYNGLFDQKSKLEHIARLYTQYAKRTAS